MENLEKIFNLKFYNRATVKEFEADLSSPERILTILNEKYDSIAKIEEIKKFFLLLEFLSKKEVFVKDEAFSKFVLRITLSEIKKCNLDNKKNALLETLKNIFLNYFAVKEESIFKKTLGLMLLKSDNKSFGVLCKIIYLTKSFEFNKTVEKRFSANLAKFEKSSFIFNPFSLLLLEEKYVNENIVLMLNKLLKKSMTNFPKIVEALSEMSQKKFADHPSLACFDNLLEIQLADAVNKGEAVAAQSFSILGQILKNRTSYQNLPKITKIFEDLTKKLYNNKKVEICQAFCELIALSHSSAFEKNAKATLKQFFDSLKILNEKPAKMILNNLIRNKSLLENPAIVNVLLHSEIKDRNIDFYFNVLLKISNTTNKEIKDIYCEKTQEELKKLDLKSNTAFGVTNFRHFIWGIGFSLINKKLETDFDLKLVARSFLKRENIWFNKNLTNFITAEESFMFLQIINEISEEIENSTKILEKTIVGILILSLVRKLEKFKMKKIAIKKSLCENLIFGIYSFLKVLNENENEYFSRYILTFLFSQSQLVLSGEETLNKFALTLSYAPIYPTSNLKNMKFYKKYMTSQVIEEFKDLQNINLIDFVFDQNHLMNFSDLVYEKTADYVSNMMYFFPNTIEKISYFFHPEIITKLTRMKKVNDLMSNVKSKNTFMWKKTELEALEVFGYVTKSFIINYFNKDKNEENDDKQCVFLYLENLTNLQETEDEKYEELENMNEKEIIMENYRNILVKINLVFSKFGMKFQKNLKEEHLQQLDKVNNKVYTSVKESLYLNDLIQIAYKNVFNSYLISSNQCFLELSEIYCYIINENNDEKVLTIIENFIERLGEPQKLNEKLFSVFYHILKFIVKYKFDVEFKKKIVNFLICSMEENSKFKLKLFSFICRNINDLYFKEIFNFIGSSMLDLSQHDEKVIDLALENLLNYEEFAIKIFLEKIKLVFENETKKPQEVLAYQKLKLLTMTESPNTDISGMANDLIAKNECIFFDVNSLKKLNFDDLILDLPFDLHLIVRTVMKNLYVSLNVEEKKNYLEKFIGEFTLLLEKISAKDEKDTYSERLEIFPNILKDISELIDEEFILKIFDCLILIEKKGFTKLNKISIEFGVELINNKSHLIEKMTNIFQTYIKSEEGLIGPIIFIGECAKIDHSLFDKFKNLESNLVHLINHKDINFHKNLSKYIRNLIRFFKEPETILNDLVNKTVLLEDPLQIRINCYFIAGMIKGIGVKCIEENQIFEKIQGFITNSKKRDLKDIFIGKRYFSVYLINALWFTLRKVLEPLITNTISILMNFLGDNLDEIRIFTKSSLDKMMKEVSSYSIKQIIPILLEGTEDKNWRKKLNSILGLGAVAYCGIKQLSENLPIIVPRLTNKINDTNENIKEAAVKSLSLILSTIKNPEISQIRDTIILSLSNPFMNNQKSLEALLSIRFMHYIDGPALSLIMPIIIYGLKNSPKSESKEKAAKVVANILALINNDEDLWPHIENLIDALQNTLKDLSPDVRGVTSKAFKSIAIKFPSLSNFMLNRLKATLVDKETISIEKAGNAQAFAEILSILDEEHFLYIFESLLNLTLDKREHVRESFLSVFVYLPIIQGQRYQKYVVRSIESIIQNIDHEKERIRNLSIKCMKIVIQNFFMENQEFLIKELYEGSIDIDCVKRNSSLILVGDAIEKIIKSKDIPIEEIFKEYAKLFSIIYIMKNDLNGEVKITALNIFKTFIDNTPKCLKIIYLELVNCFIDMYIRQSEHYNEIADNGLKEFSLKYGDVFITDILINLNSLKINADESCLLGIVIFLKQFIRFYNRNYFSEDRINKLAMILTELFNIGNDEIWRYAVKAIRFLSEMTGSVNFVKEIIEPLIDEVNTNEEKKGEETEEDGKGEKNETKIESEKVVEDEEVEEEDDEDVEVDEDDEDEDEEEEENIPKDKLIEILCELFLSENPKITNFANKYVFENSFKEWQVTIIVVNLRIYGSLLYEMKEIKKGLKLFLDFFEVN